MTIQQASRSDIPEIVQLIQRMKLDERELKPEEFLIIREENIIAAFGRIKKYGGFDELCSLGVRQRFRNKNYGTFLSTALIKKATPPLYLVTVIPSYFQKLGFSISLDHPSEINKKINYCETLAKTANEYVVMKYSH